MILLLLFIAEIVGKKTDRSDTNYQSSSGLEKPCFTYKNSLKNKDSTVCRPDGYFAARQCSSNTCWCAKEQGEKIKGTYFKKNRKYLCQNVRYYVEYRFDPSLLQLETTLKIFSEESKILVSIRSSDHEEAQWEMYDVAQIVKEDTDSALLTMDLYGYNTKLSETQVMRAIRAGFSLSSKNKDLTIKKQYDSVHPGQCPVLAECNKTAEQCFSDSQCYDADLCCQTKCSMRCIKVQTSEPKAISLTNSQEVTSATATTSPTMTDENDPTKSWYVLATGTKQTSELPGGSAITEITATATNPSDASEMTTDFQTVQTDKSMAMRTDDMTSEGGPTKELVVTQELGTPAVSKNDGTFYTTESSREATDEITKEMPEVLTEKSTHGLAVDSTPTGSQTYSLTNLKTELTDALTEADKSDKGTVSTSTKSNKNTKSTPDNANTSYAGAGTTDTVTTGSDSETTSQYISTNKMETTLPQESEATMTTKSLKTTEKPTTAVSEILTTTVESTTNKKTEYTAESTENDTMETTKYVSSEKSTGTYYESLKMTVSKKSVPTETVPTTRPVINPLTTEFISETEKFIDDEKVTKTIYFTSSEVGPETEEEKTYEATEGLSTKFITKIDNANRTTVEVLTAAITAIEISTEALTDVPITTEEVTSGATKGMTFFTDKTSYTINEVTQTDEITEIDEVTETEESTTFDKISDFTIDDETTPFTTIAFSNESIITNTTFLTTTPNGKSANLSTDKPTQSLSNTRITENLTLRTSSEHFTDGSDSAIDTTATESLGTVSDVPVIVTIKNSEAETKELLITDTQSRETFKFRRGSTTEPIDGITEPLAVTTEESEENTEPLKETTTGAVSSESTSMSQSGCEKALSDAISKQINGDRETFEPSCLRDGSYAPQQCDRARGICWCVNGQGEMIKHSQRFGTADCRGEGKTTEGTYTTTTTKSLCWTRYTEALRQQQYTPEVQIPSCEAGGLFSPSQCYRSHCWCVEQQTGTMLNGTTKAGPVNCTLLLEGVCPNFASNFDTTGCDDKCDDNTDCYGSSICCNTECGKDCILPQLPSVLKEGACPVPQSLNSIFLPESCKLHCQDDSQCGGEEKCCFTGCGYICTDPIFDSKVYCPKISSLFKGKVDDPQDRYSSEESIKFSCNYGYKIQGHSEIKCTAKGVWAFEPPVCKRVSCGPPGGGHFVVVRGNDYYVGGTAKYACYVGYTLVGANQTTCSENGLWDSVPPTCQRVSCADLGNPKYGRIYGNNRVYGARVGFRCNYGYMLVGSEQRTCMSDGVWSGADTKCVRGYYVRSKRNKFSRYDAEEVNEDEADGLPCQYPAEQLIAYSSNCIERIKTVGCNCGDAKTYETIVNVKCQHGPDEYVSLLTNIGTDCTCCT